MASKCPRCGGLIVRGECLACGYHEERCILGRRWRGKVNTQWPPMANPTGEHHTRPIFEQENEE
jgi:hypothetical protein